MSGEWLHISILVSFFPNKVHVSEPFEVIGDELRTLPREGRALMKSGVAQGRPSLSCRENQMKCFFPGSEREQCSAHAGCSSPLAGPEDRPERKFFLGEGHPHSARSHPQRGRRCGQCGDIT